MKRICSVLFGLLLFVSLSAERISPEDAALVATNFMNATSAPGVKKAAPQKMVRKATAEEYLFYVYESANGEGWVLVAANDAVTPILAYSETGHFRTDNMPANVRGWLGKYDTFILKIEADDVQASDEAIEQWTTLRKGVRRAKGDAVVGPLVKTIWDQDAPFDRLCPGTGEWGAGSSKAAVGCVATAMAQVMNYWQWPITGTGSHTYRVLDVNEPYDASGNPNYSTRYTSPLSADFGATTYDWENMLDSYTGNYTDAQANAVATLMYHCGVASEMMYGNYDDYGSGTYTVNYNNWNDHANAENALFRHFGYKKDSLKSYMRDGYVYKGTTYYEEWTDEDWTAMVKEELDKHRPILYSGAGPTAYDGGHSFICDGYDDAGFFHFNWGWSGHNDGYYKLSNLKPGGGGAGGGAYNFSYDQDVIIGVVPDGKPTDVSHEVVAPKAAKIIDNGQVYILRDGVRYTILGTKQ